jgi:chromate transporter
VRVELNTEGGGEGKGKGKTHNHNGRVAARLAEAGVQSFGGGSATLFQIRRAVVEQHGWISEEEFVRDLSLCYMVPGMNLLGLTILVGRRLAGWRGVLLSLLGLMLPSVAITAAIAASYALLQQLSVAQTALRGIVPASVGLGLLVALGGARSLLGESRQKGRATLMLSLVLLVGSLAVAVLWHPPVLIVLCTGGALGGIAAWWSDAVAPERAGWRPITRSNVSAITRAGARADGYGSADCGAGTGRADTTKADGRDTSPIEI